MKNQWESSKLNFFKPDAFGFIRDLTTSPPERDERLINLSIGAPNRPTPAWILEEMQAKLNVAEYHTYPPPFGSPELREAVAAWYMKRFHVNIDPDQHVLVTVGIKEAIMNAFLALVNPGDGILIPDPGYPTYFEATLFAGGKLIPYYSDTDEAHVLNDIERKAREYQPKIVVVNYPGNPTGRLVSKAFYDTLAELSSREHFLVMSDLAYSEIAFDNLHIHSFLETSMGVQQALEYFAFSKTYNMAGWRVGAIIGAKDVVDAVKLYKSKLDSNVFYPIQLAAAAALENTPDTYYAQLKALYAERRDAICQGLTQARIEFSPPQGAMYVWVKVPGNMDSWQFTTLLYKRYGLLVVPGIAYGKNGGNHVRIGLVQETPLMEEAAQRLAAGIGADVLCPERAQA